MDPQEQNYWRGYVDGMVENLGKSRTHHTSMEDKLAYRDKLLAKYGITI